MAKNEQECWARVKDRLRSSVGDDVYNSWFARVDLEQLNSEAVHMSVPTRFLKSWIQTHYAERVLGCWQEELPNLNRIELTVRTPVRSVAPAKDAKAATDDRRAERGDARAHEGGRTAISAMAASAGHEALGGSPLDPRLTFETFVIGRSNTLAHAAARQVAEGRRGDTVMFNPLYIHAGVGLGKTHLLQAITFAGNALGQRKVLYLTAEKFMYGFVSALKAQTAIAFKETLRAIDVLVIDDLQFLQGKSTQAEFCHTLNALIDSGRQVVIAADRPPSDLESLDDRVRSRLAGGLVVEMGSLGEELRLEILKSRVNAARILHPSFDVPPPVLDYLARTITHNGRDLEGAINRLLAHNTLERPGGDAGDGRARGARPDPPAGAAAGEDRGHPARGGAAIQRQPLRPVVLAPHRQCGAAAAGGDVSRQDADAALAAGDRPALRRPRSHHGAARGAQDRGAGGQGHDAGRRGRALEAPAAGLGVRAAHQHSSRLQMAGEMPPRPAFPPLHFKAFRATLRPPRRISFSSRRNSLRRRFRCAALPFEWWNEA